jgi:propionyl-CoA carboxylase beta chain
VTHFVYPTGIDALEAVRYLMSYLPRNNMELPPYFAPADRPDRLDDSLDSIIPDSANQPYDMVELLETVLDSGEFLEVHEMWAKNIVIGFGRLDGHAVGVVANQPSILAGTLDIEASEKAARFVRFCDAFNIPIVTFVDVPGFLPGVEQEHGGIIRHGAKLLYAYCEATVPRITVITRKAYGGAYLVMNARGIRADLVFAWPSAEIAVMGAQGAVNVIHRREISSAEDPDQTRTDLIADYEDTFNNPYVAAELGLVDEVIEPRETRYKLIRALEVLRTKRETLPPKKHGNGPQ